MASSGLGGFQRLRVIEKTQESSVITSLRLEPLVSEPWRPFEPGQFLVFKIPVGNAGGHILRTYSVSSSPEERGAYRITVKREAAANEAAPPGEGSRFLHDDVSIGDTLLADGPRGAFTLDRMSSRAVALISGGVGLTPLVSMLHALAAQCDRKVYFLHACDNGDVHALDREVRDLAASRPGIAVRVIYRSPTPRDREEQRHHFEGLITRDLLQQILPLDDYDVYLCGPPRLMQSVHPLLRSLGVPKAQIATEFFGPATLSGADVDTLESPPLRSRENPARGGSAGPLVTFQRSGREAVWSDNLGSLLEFAEAAGLQPPFSCRAGICNACRTRVIDGDVDYFETPLDPPEPGEALLCCSRPAGPLVLDL